MSPGSSCNLGRALTGPASNKPRRFPSHPHRHCARNGAGAGSAPRSARVCPCMCLNVCIWWLRARGTVRELCSCTRRPAGNVCGDRQHPAGNGADLAGLEAWPTLVLTIPGSHLLGAYAGSSVSRKHGSDRATSQVSIGRPWLGRMLGHTQQRTMTWVARW